VTVCVHFSGTDIPVRSLEDRHLSRLEAFSRRAPAKNFVGFQSSVAGSLFPTRSVATFAQSRPIKLRAAVILTITVYALAIGGSDLLTGCLARVVSSVTRARACTILKPCMQTEPSRLHEAMLAANILASRFGGRSQVGKGHARITGESEIPNQPKIISL
jgi:hypothetical protein